MIVIKKILSVFLVILIFVSSIPISAFSLSWDGDSAGGSIDAVNGSNTGYVIRDTNDSNCVVGYRFSAVDADGNMKVTKVIDVFRNTSNGNNAYSTSAKFSKKYNKLGVIENKNATLSTTLNTTNCYKESNISFVTSLPNPSGVETWQSYESNINQVLSKLGIGSVDNMVYGDKVIIEPLFDICLAGEYQALTVTEMAYCGRSVLGGTSTGGTSNGTSSTWGFIAVYTNRIWPNKLYTPNGQGLWTAATEIGSSAKATFNNILTKGYGAGIAYNETANITYTIKFNGNGSTSGSTASMSMSYGTAKNLTANGFTKTGHYFTGWNTKSDGSGTDYSNQQSVKNLTTTNGATVNLYAQWSPYKLKVSFNANGGSVDSTTYYLSSKVVYKESDSSKYIQTWTYNNTKDNGITNASTFGLYRTGYTFSSWGTSSSGGTIFSQSDNTLKPTDLNSGIKTGDVSMTLYAQWSPITYTINFNGNGYTSGSTSSMSMTYDTAKNLTANGFTKSGYHFAGWNTKADGSGTSYYDQQSVKNLTTTNGGTVTLYAKWDTNSYIIAFNGNGYTSGTTSSMNMKFDTSNYLTANGYSKTGYTFSHWNTRSDNGGTSYSNQQLVKNLTTTNGATVYLYAQWTPITYTIKFNGNGYTGGSTSSMSMTYDVAKNLNANGFVRSGYKFAGWNTKSDGSGTSYSNQQSVKNLSTTNGGSITLYAQWTPITYTIKFNGNGYTGGSTSSMSMTYDVAKNLTANGFAKTSYKFVEWNTKADGSGTSYADKQSVKNLTTTDGATVNLYAQWQYDPVLLVEQCNVYEGEKSDKSTLFGYTKGNVFDDYVYKTNYPVLGDTIWYNIYFPSESVSFKARQYVRYKGGSWTTRDVTLSGSDSSSQYFPIQFTGNYMTVPDSIGYYEIEAKTDWIDASGNVLKSGTVKTFYIPVKPVAYRYRVEARGYESVVTAYNGMDGSSGTLYSGQHVKLTYKFKGGNTWQPIQYLRGALYYYNGSKWVNAYTSNDGYDVARNKAILSKAGVTSLSSSLNTYTVPLTSQNKLRFNLITWWMNDQEHTEESSWIELPVEPCDLQLDEIKLYDASTNRELDPNNLEAGQKVKIRYIYYNNTNAKVYNEAYNNSKEKINNAVYSIPAKCYAGLWGETITVPNKRTFTIWGGIYQEGMGMGNTSYESDGTNNELTLTCKVNHPLTLAPITPNAAYREDTEVVTSFWLKNNYTDNYIPSDGVDVRFRVYRNSTLLHTEIIENVVVPGSDKNLLYFKWRVPTGLNGGQVKITGEIIEDGVSYNLKNMYNSTVPYIISETPDTQFEKKKPSGFSTPILPATTSGAASWWLWKYVDGSYVKYEYAIGISNATPNITPATGETATKVSGLWNMKSGYGVSLSLTNSASSVTGYSIPNSDSYTTSQYAIALFPEFGYEKTEEKFRTLELSSGKWRFRQNGTYGFVHFTPLWYPDGDYTVCIEQRDFWTPSGMLTRSSKADPIRIIDSAYDDWYVGR
jgi:uncharacterized repeat protein (TIGR02543 family)